MNDPLRSWIRSGLTPTNEWHVLGNVDDDGWRSRCGLVMPNDAKVKARMPRNEAICGTCLEDVVADSGPEAA